MEIENKELIGSILLPARTDSEWDSCDAYLIEPDRKMFEDLIAKMDEATRINVKAENGHNHNTGFSCIVYHGGYGYFKIIVEPDDWKGSDEECPVIIDEEINALLEIIEPENPIGTDIIKAYPECVVFVGYGKHTGEEFWTSDFTRSYINELLEKL